MTIDITIFHQVNIIDSCAVWNVLSSNHLYVAAIKTCFFDVTQYVEYECLHKPRTIVNHADGLLKMKFEEAREKNIFQTRNLSIDDLQDITSFERNIRLGLGELSSIAYAKKIGQAFMTDDQKARKLAEKILGKNKVQTTPHLVGWLVYKRLLNDTDIHIVIKEHNTNGRPLEKYFMETYNEALRIRCMNNSY